MLVAFNVALVGARNEYGHELTINTDGVVALEALNRHNGEFELILTDLKMPEVDGIALALATARDHPDIAIILMTGIANQRERTHGLDALLHDAIVKPFSVDQIKSAVREAMVHRHKARGRGAQKYSEILQ